MLPCRWTPLSWSVFSLLDPLTSPSRACLILFFSPRHLLSSSSFFASASNLSPPAALPPQFFPTLAALSRFRPQCSAPYVRRCQALFLHLLASPPPLFNLRRLCILSNNSYTVLRTFTIPFFYQRKSCLFLEHVL